MYMKILKSPVIYAHRGASAYAPENTMPAFEKALEFGADGIELDVHLTKDNYIVVCHDEWTGRISSKNLLIKDTTYKELCTLDFGGWFSPKYKGTKIPLFEEVLNLLKDWNGILDIEIKCGGNYYPGIEQKCIDMLKEHNFLNKIIFCSFDHDSMEKVKSINSNIPVGLLYGEAIQEPWNYAKKRGADALHPYYQLVDFKMVDMCRKNNILINAWTLNEEIEIKKYIEMGIDGVITNKPDIALKLRDKLYRNH